MKLLGWVNLNVTTFAVSSAENRNQTNDGSSSTRLPFLFLEAAAFLTDCWRVVFVLLVATLHIVSWLGDEL